MIGSSAWDFVLPVFREDHSRAAHPGMPGQGRAQREARGRSLAAAAGMRQPIPASFIPPVVIPHRALLSDAFSENLLGTAEGLENHPGSLRCSG